MGSPITPIMQPPYLRDLPLHEEQGPLGGIGQALSALGQGLEKKREFNEQQASREEQAQSLAALRDTEAGKLSLEQKKLQTQIDTTAANQRAIDASVGAIKDPETQNRVRLLLSLGNSGLDKEAMNAVATTLAPVHGIDPKFAAPLANLLHTGSMTVGQAYGALGLDPNSLTPDVRDFKPPKQMTVLDDIREQRLKLDKVQRALVANDKEVQRVQRLKSAFEAAWDKTHTVPIGATLTPDQQQQLGNQRMIDSNRYLSQIAPNFGKLLSDREQLRQQLQIEAGFSRQFNQAAQAGAGAGATGPNPGGDDADIQDYRNQFLQLVKP